MATITFHANNENIYTESTGNQPDLINSNAGSGLGFFGGSLGLYGGSPEFSRAL